MSARSPGSVVVTGASAGVGRAIAIAFGRKGWNVGLIARGRAGLINAKRAVEAAGGRALAMRLDVADPDAMFTAADAVVAEWGAIDIWVNDAMATVFAPVDAITPEEFRRVTEVTYLGQVYGTMAALRHMRRRDRGTIIQIGSALSYRAIPLQSAYCGAKFAIRGFTDSVRSELEHDGSDIRITMVQLPAANTPQFDWARNRLPRRPRPLAPIYQPEAIARRIVRAADDPPRELWLGWSTLKAIVGTMILPGLGDRVVAREAYGGQMDTQPARRRPDNLFVPVGRDPGAHGRFDAEARRRVARFDPRWLRAGAAGLALAVLAGGPALGRCTKG
jgi:NAD(P)-dependent dehydrogenase (short-subunit alcohol dehydrogenase family)